MEHRRAGAPVLHHTTSATGPAHEPKPQDVELRTLGFPGLGWLTDGLTCALGRLRHKTSPLSGLIRHAGSDL